MGTSIDRFLQADKNIREGRTDDLPESDFTDVTGGASTKVAAASTFGPTNPEKAARVLSLERKTGLAPDLIERNLDEVDLQVWRSEFAPAAQMATPKVRDWLAENPNHVPAAAKDLTKLNYLERQVQFITGKLKSSVTQQRIRNLTRKDFQGKISQGEREELDVLESMLGNQPTAEDYGLSGFLETSIGEFAGQAGVFASIGTAAAQGATAGAVTGALAGPAAPVTVPVAAGIGAAIGVFTDAADQMAMEAFRDFSKLEDENGNPLDRTTAQGAAIGVGLLGGALEYFSLGKTANVVPGVRALKRTLSQGAVKKALASRTVKGAVAENMKNVAIAMGTEGATEYMQGAVQDVAGTIELMIQDGSASRLGTAEALGRIFSDEHLAAWKEQGIVGAQVGMITAGAGGVASTAIDARRAVQAQRNARFFEALGSVAEKAELSKTLPEKMQEVVERLTKDGPVENVHAPVETFTEYWQSQDVDPREMAQELTGDADAYDQALAMGHDLIIPTSRYAKIAGTKHHEFFKRELRLAPDQMNAREADAYFEEQQNVQAQEPTEEAVDPVREYFREQLAGANYTPGQANTQADLYAALFRSYVQERGEIDPTEYLRQRGITVSRVDSDGPVVPPAPVSVRDDQGRLRANLRNVPEAELEAELVKLMEQNASEEGLAASVTEAGYRDAYEELPRTEKLGRKGQEDLPDADMEVDPERLAGDNAILAEYNKRTVARQARAQAITRIQSELDQRRAAADYEAGGRLAGDELVDDEGNVLFQVAAAPPTESPAFQAWFGDSKAVDEKGAPLVVFHGRVRDFTEFQEGHNNGFSNPRQGFYFTDEIDAAREFGKPVEVYLSIQNPADFTDGRRDVEAATLASIVAEMSPEDAAEYAGLTPSEVTFQGMLQTPQFVAAAKKAGYDGIFMDDALGHSLYFRSYIAFRPEQIKSATDNRGTYDPNSPNILYQGQRLGNRLSVMHNLMPDNLLYADKVGGLPVPSLGVVPEGMSWANMGAITLIGRKHLADPREGVPLYDADVWSATFPKPEYKKASVKQRDALFKSLAPFFYKLRDTSSEYEMDNALQRGDPARAIEKALTSVAVQAAFLKEKGVDVELVMRDARVDVPYVGMPALRAYAEANDGNFVVDDDDVEGKKALAEAVRAAIDEYVAEQVKRDPSLADDAEVVGEDTLVDFLRKGYVRRTFHENGSVVYGAQWRLTDDYKKIGTQEIDSYATADRAKELLKGQEPEFKDWVEAKVLPMHGEPVLTLGRKKVPYNLDNIVKFMKRGETKAAQEHMTFGEGKARAAAAVRITSLQEARNRAETQIGTDEEIETKRQEVKQLMSDWRDAVLPFYKYPDTWSALDDSMRSLARAAQGHLSEVSLKAALQRFDFVGVPADVVKQGVKAGWEFLSAPVPYFEAKPQRAVTLDEFAGAVVPQSMATPEVMTVLEKHGIESTTYDDATANEQVRADAIANLQRELSDKGEPVLFQRQGGQARARILFGENEVRIEMFRSANLSSFLHESGHLFLNILEDLATRPDAKPEIVADYQAVRAEFGVPDGESFSREHQEQWARQFEAYLMTGKAPSQALRKAFASFRAWLVRVYREIRNLDVEVSPELRRIFDRMLATDDEIAAAQAEAGLSGIADSLRAAGIPEAQVESIARAESEARQAAEEYLGAKLMRDITREQEAMWEADRERVRGEVIAEMMEDPKARAISILTRGVLPDGSNLEGVVGILKLSRRALLAEYENRPQFRDLLKRLPRPYVYSRDGGIHPDEAATHLGYESGEELLMALLDAKPIKQMVDEQTEERLQADAMLTSEELPIEAMAAVHNEKQAQVNRKILELLARNDLPALKTMVRRVTRRIPPSEAVVQFAKDVIGRKKIRELNPLVYQRAEQKAARASIDALLRGDVETAFAEQLRRQTNFELHRQALAAREAIDGLEDDVRKLFQRDEKIGATRDLDFVNAARALAAAYGFKEAAPESYLEQVQSYDKDVYNTVKAMVDEAMPENGQLTDFKEATFDEAVKLREAIEVLWAKARTNRQHLIDGERVERGDILEKLSAQVRLVGTPYAGFGSDQAPTKAEERKVALLGIRAALRRVESWVDLMDGNDPNGPFRRYVWTPIREAADRFRDDKGKYLTKYAELVNGIGPTITHAKIPAPELVSGKSGRAYTFTDKGELLGMLLHTGNESNADKLVRGRGWTTDGLERFIKRMQAEGVLTKADYDFVQGIWDLFEEMKPAAQKAHKEMYGRYFSEITAKPFTTPFGEYRGGYVPARTDRMMVADQMIREEQNEMEAGNSFNFPSTGEGFTKKRSEKYARELSMKLDGVEAHIDWVLRFTHLQPRVKEVAKLFWNPQFRDLMAAGDPAVVSRMIMPWLNRAASQRVEKPGKYPDVDRAARFIRRNTGLGIMAGNIVNTMQQLTGVSIAAIKVRPKYLRHAFVTYLQDRKKMGRDIEARSAFMRTRFTATYMEAQREVDHILLNPSKYEKVVDFANKHGYFMQTATQGLVDKITWAGAYAQAVEGGAEEQAAVREADAAVRATQGSFAPEDMADFEAGTPGGRLFTMFSGYFNMMANLNATEFSVTVREMGIKKGAGRLLYLYAYGFLIPAFVGDLIAQAMRGDLDDEDDDGYLDEYLALFFGSQFRTATAFVPFVGQVAQLAVNRFDKKFYNDKLSMSPAVSLIEKIGGTPQTVWKAVTDDGSRKRAVQDILLVLGWATKLPLPAVGRPVGYLLDVEQGKTEPTGAVDLVRGVLTGR